MNAHIPLSPSLESLLAQYAVGSLGHGMSVLVASFATLSPSARRQLDAFESLNGYLLEEAEAAPMADSSFDNVLNRLDGEDDSTDLAAANDAGSQKATDKDLPLPLRDVFNHSFDSLPWRFAYPGVRHFKLAIGDAGEEVRLLKIKPGKAAPRHTHKGIEATLVLRGAFRDGNRLYERGQLALADQHVQHRPRAEGDEDCICLAVTDGALRFTDSLGRVARDFFSRA